MSEILNVLTSLGFNVHIALANFFNFLIIFFLLQKFLFKKIAKTLHDRKNVIEEGVRKSEESEQILTETKQNAKNIVLSAEKKSEEIIKAEEIKAKALAKDIKNEALAISEALKKEAETIKADSYEAGLAELASKKDILLAGMFEKALVGFMTEDKNDSFIMSLKK